MLGPKYSKFFEGGTRNIFSNTYHILRNGANVYRWLRVTS